MLGCFCTAAVRPAANSGAWVMAVPPSVIARSMRVTGTLALATSSAAVIPATPPPMTNAAGVISASTAGWAVNAAIWATSIPI